MEKEPAHLACFLETASCDRPTLHQLLHRLVEANPRFTAREWPSSRTRSTGMMPFTVRIATVKRRHNVRQIGTESYNYFRYDWYCIPKLLSAPAWSEPYFDEGGGQYSHGDIRLPFLSHLGGGLRETFRG